MRRPWVVVRYAALAVSAVVILSAGSCSPEEGSKWNQGDAPRSDVVNKAPADLINMPDGYSNVATKCDHGNRIYVMFHGDSPSGSIFVVPTAPGCTK